MTCEVPRDITRIRINSSHMVVVLFKSSYTDWYSYEVSYRKLKMFSSHIQKKTLLK